MIQKRVLLLAISAPFAVTAQMTIVDATKNFVKSTESTFDHEISLKKAELSFHWNDVEGNTVMGRLIHTAPSIAEAPSWLAIGFYATENKANITVNTPFMIGSDAVIGIVEPGSVKKYSLDGKVVAVKDGVHPTERQTLVFSSIVRHDSDDGTVTTVLSFEKLLEESNTNEVRLLQSGVNVFLWAVGPPGAKALSKHTSKGVFTLDLMAVQKQAGSSNSDGSTTGDVTTDGNDSTGDRSKNIASVVDAQCNSNVEPGFLMLELMPGISFHWKVDDSTFSGVFQYEGEGWLGWGFSKDGSMIGSSAIIGLPEENTVNVRKLNDKSVNGISVSPEQNLIESSITQEKGITQLRFKKALDTSPIIHNGENTFIFAIGESNKFGYHQHRNTVRVKDLVSCSNSNEDGSGSGMTHLGAFAAHGTIATLAWGIASPFAITVAWFRTLVPSSWIYIHVFSNVLSFFFTLIAVIVAISAMSIQPAGAGGHFSDPHHWVGLVLLVAVTFQVMNGFLRPPVEKKDPYAASHYDMDNSSMKCPRSPREVWYFSHRTTGIAMLAMGIYQIQSGLNLFAADFNVTSITPIFWGYVGLFAFCLITLKFWIMFEEFKARRGMEAMHVDHRSAGGSSGGLSHTDSELVPVQFDMS